MANIIITLISAWDTIFTSISFTTDGIKFFITPEISDEFGETVPHEKLKGYINPDLIHLFKTYTFETFDEADEKFDELCETLGMEHCHYHKGYADLFGYDFSRGHVWVGDTEMP